MQNKHISSYHSNQEYSSDEISNEVFNNAADLLTTGG